MCDFHWLLLVGLSQELYSRWLSLELFVKKKIAGNINKLSLQL